MENMNKERWTGGSRNGTQQEWIILNWKIRWSYSRLAEWNMRRCSFSLCLASSRQWPRTDGSVQE